MSVKRRELPCTINGVRYESLVTAAKALEIDRRTMRNRLRSSNFPEYISEHHEKIKRKKPTTSIRCIIKGVEYASIANASKKLKITAPTISYRLRSFRFPDYVSPDIPKNISKYRYTANGKKYATLQEIADAEGETLRHVTQKIYNPKKTEYQRLETTSVKRPRILCTIDGVRYESLLVAAGALGIDLNTVRNRLLSSNFPEYVSEHYQKKNRKKAVFSRKPREKEKFFYTINGIHYETITAAARALKVQPNTVRKRLRSSNFPEYISEHHEKIKRKKPTASIRCIIKRVEYASVADASKKLKMGSSTIYYRLKAPNFPDYVSPDIPKHIPKYRYRVNGKEYATLQEIADAEGETLKHVTQKIYNPKKTEYQRLETTSVKRPRLPCTIDGVLYESEKVAAATLGIDPGTMRNRLRSSNFPEYKSKHHPKVKRKEKVFSCTINGVFYKSESTAARVLEIDTRTLRKRLCSFNYPEYTSKHHKKSRSSRH